MRITLLLLLFPLLITAQAEVELMFQKGHHEPIYAMAQSPDGKTLATAGTDLTVRFLDIESGIEYQTFRGKQWTLVDEDAKITSLEFSKDGQYLMCSMDSDVFTEYITIRLKDNKVIFKDPNPRNPNIVGGFFSPDGSSVVYCHSLKDKYLKIHNLETKEISTKDLSHLDDKNPENPLLTLYWTALHNKVQTSSDKKNIWVWGRAVINDEITIVAFTVDAKTLKPITLTSLPVIKDNTFLEIFVPSKDDKYAYVLPTYIPEGWNKVPWHKYSLQTGDLVESFYEPITSKTKEMFLNYSCLSPLGEFIFTYKDSIYVSDPGDPTIKKVWSAKTLKGNTDKNDINHLGNITAITSSVDGKSVFVSFAGKNKKRRSDQNIVWHGDFLPDFISIRQIDLATGHVINSYVSLGKMIDAISFDPKGKSLFVVESRVRGRRYLESPLSVWNFREVGPLSSLNLSGLDVKQFIFSPNKKECFVETKNTYGAGLIDLKNFTYKKVSSNLKVNPSYTAAIDKKHKLYSINDMQLKNKVDANTIELPKEECRGKPFFNFLNEGKEIALFTEGEVEDLKITSPSKLHFYDLKTAQKTGELDFSEFFFSSYDALETISNKDETLFAFVAKQVLDPVGRNYDSGLLYIIDPSTRQIKTKIPLITKDCFAWDRLFLKTGKRDQVMICQPIDVTTLSFSPDSKLILGGWGDNSIKVWDVVTGKEVNSLKGHLNLVTDIAFHPKKNLMASSSQDGQIIFWNTETWNILAKMIVIGAEDYIIYTNQGYYMATHKAIGRVAFKKEDRFFGVEQFDLKYNRPDIVMDSLGLASSFMIRTLKKAYHKRLQHLGYTEDMLNTEFHVPKLSLQKPLPFEVSNSSLKFQLELEDEKEELKKLNVYVNDVPIYGLHGKSLKGSKRKENVQISLSEGLNYLTLSVTNSKGSESMQKKMVINNTQTKANNKNLHLLVVGVSEYQDSTHNLTFSAKDANDIQRLFAKQGKHYDSIHVQSLTNQKATTPNVLAALKGLQKSTVDDEIIVFFSCHGLLDKQLNYYLAMHETNFNDPAQGGLPYHDIEKALASIPARKRLMFIDACHSGEVDKSELILTEKDNTNDVSMNTKGGQYKVKSKLNNSFAYMKVLFADMGKGTGTTIISAAGGSEYALESNEWGNGVFTYSILKGLNSKAADINRDKQVNISELQKYVTSMVNELTDGKQLPTTRHVNYYGDFSIYKY